MRVNRKILPHQFRIALALSCRTTKDVAKDLSISVPGLHRIVHGKSKSARVEKFIERFISAEYKKAGIKRDTE